VLPPYSESKNKPSKKPSRSPPGCGGPRVDHHWRIGLPQKVILQRLRHNENREADVRADYVITKRHYYLKKVLGKMQCEYFFKVSD
jgi:hypothetical protein